VNDDDAEAFAIADAAEGAILALEADCPVIGAVRIDAAQHLHQRGLARAVLADDGVYLAGADADRDVVERLDARKRLGDPAHFEKRLQKLTSWSVVQLGWHPVPSPIVRLHGER
jgi:hypothetical protein